MLQSTTCLPTSFQIGGTGKNKPSVGFEKTKMLQKRLLISIFFKHKKKKRSTEVSTLSLGDHSCIAGLFECLAKGPFSDYTPADARGVRRLGPDLGDHPQPPRQMDPAVQAQWPVREGLHALCSRNAMSDHAFTLPLFLRPCLHFHLF